MDQRGAINDRNPTREEHAAGPVHTLDNGEIVSLAYCVRRIRSYLSGSWSETWELDRAKRRDIAERVANDRRYSGQTVGSLCRAALEIAADEWAENEIRKDREGATS